MGIKGGMSPNEQSLWTRNERAGRKQSSRAQELWVVLLQSNQESAFVFE